jgi:hypothetical protein
VAGYNLAETGRHIEIAGACKDIFNVDAPINRGEKWPLLLISGLSGKNAKIF